MSNQDSKYSFANDEVTVTIPAEHAGRLRAAARPIGSVDMHPPAGFQPIRVVANIVIEAQSKPEAALTDLGCQVKIKVKYRAADLQAAGGKPLVLAFWDGQGWVPLTAAKHAFKLTPYADSRNGGYATVSINRWGDPPISWGT